MVASWGVAVVVVRRQQIHYIQSNIVQHPKSLFIVQTLQPEVHWRRTRVPWRRVFSSNNLVVELGTKETPDFVAGKKDLLVHALRGNITRNNAPGDTE